MVKKLINILCLLGLIVQYWNPVYAIHEEIPEDSSEEEIETIIENEQEENIVSASVVTAWSWADPLGQYTDNILLIPLQPGQQMDYSSVELMLPLGVNLILEDGLEVVEPVVWSCESYLQDVSGQWPAQGDYVFTAELNSSYLLAENVPAMQITVILQSMAEEQPPVEPVLEINEQIFPDP